MKLFKSSIEYVPGLSFTQIIDLYLKEYGITVIKYFKTKEGSAYLYNKTIEIPYLHDIESVIIAFHEIGHIVNAPLFETMPAYMYEYWTEQWAINEAKKWKIEDSKYISEAKKYVKTYLNDAAMNGIDINKIPKYIRKWTNF